MGCASSASAAQSGVVAPVLEIAHDLDSFRANYDVKHELGRGAFGQVLLCANKATREEKAVKILKPSNLKEQTQAAKELTLWKQLGAHENVVVLLDSYVEQDVHYFVMERCCCSISKKFPLKGSARNYVDFLGAYQQVLLGLAHCHSMRIIHRDLKSANLLVDSSGIVKIADFGLSVAMPAAGAVFGVVGSTPFMSPEMAKGKPYGFLTDVWSCGAVIYSCVYGSYAYDSPMPSTEVTLQTRKEHMMRAIATDYPRPAYKAKVGEPCPSNGVRDFIKTLLRRAPETRPTAELSAQLISQVKTRLQSSTAHADRQVSYSIESDGVTTCSKDDKEGSHLCDTRCPSDTWSCAPSGVSFADTVLQNSALSV